MSFNPSDVFLGECAVCANCGGIFHKSMVVDTRVVVFTSKPKDLVAILIKEKQIRCTSAVQWNQPICWSCADDSKSRIVDSKWYVIWKDDPRIANLQYRILNPPKLPEDVK